MMIRVMLADDNPTFLAAVRQFLSALPGTEVVGEAHNGREAMELAGSLHPDLVLLDIGMPEMNGLEAARRMQQWQAPPCIVVLSMHGGQAYRDAARQVGAAGFISKADFVDELPRMIETVEERMRQQTSAQVPSMAK
jgi:two-component system, NarL family, nitrate/nitrite response regulator NarL